MQATALQLAKQTSRTLLQPFSVSKALRFATKTSGVVDLSANSAIKRRSTKPQKCRFWSALAQSARLESATKVSQATRSTFSTTSGGLSASNHSHLTNPSRMQPCNALPYG